jgi:hypothetical protein
MQGRGDDEPASSVLRSAMPVDVERTARRVRIPDGLERPFRTT